MRVYHFLTEIISLAVDCILHLCFVYYITVSGFVRSGLFFGEMCGLTDEPKQPLLTAVNSNWSLLIWGVVYKRRGMILGAVRGFVSR